jgi:hypothetical protein
MHRKTSIANQRQKGACELHECSTPRQPIDAIAVVVFVQFVIQTCNFFLFGQYFWHSTITHVSTALQSRAIGDGIKIRRTGLETRPHMF